MSLLLEAIQFKNNNLALRDRSSLLRSQDSQVNFFIVFSGALARAKRACSGAPWVAKFGKLSIRENLVMT